MTECRFPSLSASFHPLLQPSSCPFPTPPFRPCVLLNRCSFNTDSLSSSTMRRFVKSLVFKRDKPDNQKSTPDCPPSSTSDDGHVISKKGRKPPHSLRIKSFISTTSSRARVASSLASSPSTPQLSVNSDHVHSSSASSSGSVDVNLQTPDDDRASLLRYPTKDTWVVHKSASAVSVRDRTSRELDRLSSKEWLDHPPQISQVVPAIDSPSRKFVGEFKPGIPDLADDALTGSDNDHLHVARVQMTLDVVRENLRLLIESKLVPVPVSHPLASSTGPLYPRSCNRNADLPRENSMQYTLFQKRLLGRINETSSDVLSLPIVTTRRSVSRDPLASLSPYDIPWPSKTLQITPYSVGVRRWIARPCFEDAHNVYFPSSEGIVARQVSGTSLGVPALDYSDALDTLADPSYYSPDASSTEIPIVTVVPPSTPEMTLSPQPPSTTANLMSPSILVRNHVSAVPSPLRHDTLSSPSNRKEDNRPSNVENGPPVNPVRRGVHFVDDEDDALPLHLIRMKRKREEKAKFLRSEQRRREVEAWQTLRVAEEERRRRESERIEMEKDLRERRAQEEANRQRLYQEEVNATRLRREMNRAGVPPSGSMNSLAPSSSTRHLREKDRASRPREARYSRSSSGHDILSLSRGESSSIGTPAHSSSGSSKAPSVTGQQTSTSNVRPALMHHSSEEISQSIRNSTIGQGSLRPSASRLSTYPMWPNGLFVPPVSLVPPYMMPIDPSLSMDMPLLPPVPPFMQQYHRRSSRGSSNSSSSRAATSSNSSLERLDQLGRSLTPSSSSSRSSGIALVPPAHRHSTSYAELRRASIPPPTGKSETLSASHSQPSAMTKRRPRAASKQQPQPPNPWTALPTKTGALPVAMPRTR
ncbi:hypothetical protein JOM56_008514 [Amanita muscaria]